MFIKEMTIGEALEVHPEVGMVLSAYHLGGCSHCSVNEVETIEQVCEGYGVDVDELLCSMNSLLNEDEQLD
jgi:hybrid cluster-associated redox disulfide protein